jgi:hypothetical protein
LSNHQSTCAFCRRHAAHHAEVLTHTMYVDENCVPCQPNSRKNCKPALGYSGPFALFSLYKSVGP